MSEAGDTLRAGLAAIVGESLVASDPQACAAMAVGSSLPRYVVSPPSAECVAAVLKYAAEHDLAVVPRGNGTKIQQGSPPRRYDLALSLQRLTQVRRYEASDLTISAEAGMSLGDLQKFVGREGLWLPLDPLGGARASLGGILATNSSGHWRLRFGSPRDMVLGIKVATTEGKLVKSGGHVVKNVAGYDLTKLLLGSYGTLGVIVEASLKLFPRPARRGTFVLEPETLALARSLRQAILNSPLEPLGMVLMQGEALNLLGHGRAAPHASGLELWIEAGGSPAILGRHARDLAELARSMGVPEHRVEEQTAENCWDLLTSYERLFAGSFPEILVVKAMLPIAACEEFLSFAHQAAAGEGLPLASFAQVGVGIVHLGLWGEKIGEAANRVVTNTRKAALSLGGALVVEHYPSNSHPEVWCPPGDSLAAMRALKTAWDPKGVLAPGRFVGGL